jgi:hypothetical protein
VKKIERTIELLKRGWLTALESAQQGGCLSLSQRCGQLREEMCWQSNHKFSYRFVIVDKWVKTAGGARVKAYKIAHDYKKG